MVNITIGKKIWISGMALEIVADAGDKWETRNLTTKETVLMDKAVLDHALRFGKAEDITERDNK